MLSNDTDVSDDRAFVAFGSTRLHRLDSDSTFLPENLIVLEVRIAAASIPDSSERQICPGARFPHRS